jgi:hypothetical protein
MARIEVNRMLWHHIAFRTNWPWRGLFLIGTGISIYGGITGQTSGAKAALNVFIGAVGEFGGPPGLVISGGYFIIDATVGWPEVLRAQAELIERNRAIQGPGWSPFGGPSKW